MKIKSVCLYLLFFLTMASVSFAQEKKEEEKKEEKPFVCPCTCTCVELATDGVIPSGALNSIPFDEFFMFYWKKGSEEVLNGKFTIKSKKVDSLTGGNVTNYGDYLTAKVFKFLPANEIFTIIFTVGVGPSVEIKEKVKEKIVDFFTKLSAKPVKEDIEKLRADIVKDLSPNAVKFIKPGTLLDLSKPYSFNNSDGELFQPLKSVNDFLKTDRKSRIEAVKAKLDTSFRSGVNIKIIEKIEGKTTAKLIRRINNSDDFATKIFSGKVNVLTGDELEEIPAIEKINKTLLEKYVKNLEELIVKANDWQGDIKLSPEVSGNLGRLKSDYKDVLNKIVEIQSQLDGAVRGSLVNQIIESFELKIDSDIIPLETSARAYVGFDLGAMMTQLTPEADSYRIIPYVGVNLYFSAVNKRAPIGRLFQQRRAVALLKTISLHAGITIPTLSSKDYKGIYDVENPKGFMIGIGFRPYRAFKFSGGFLLQNAANGNTFNESFRLSSKPYFSVSLDWEIRNILPDIKSLISK